MILGPKRFWLGWAIVLATFMGVTLPICVAADPLNLLSVALAVFSAHIVLTIVVVIIRVIEKKVHS